jgi:protein-S-isoprenylcysteine O-methyltransferase Ste14
MYTLELKVPPPAVMLAAGALMWLVARLAPFAAFALPGRLWLAAGLALAGFLLAAPAILAFRRARTTVHPMDPGKTTSLVVGGVYRFTRNPMYLGLALLLAGWGLYLANALAFLLLPAFVAYIGRFQIAPEERALAAKFGPDYDAYRARARRWL